MKMELHNRIVKIGENLGKVVHQFDDSIEVLLMDYETCDYVKVNTTVDKVKVSDNFRDLTIDEFVLELENEYHFDDLIEEIKLVRDFGGSDKLLSETVIQAKKNNVYLNDLIDFDYDKLFYEIIKNYRR